MVESEGEDGGLTGICGLAGPQTSRTSSMIESMLAVMRRSRGLSTRSIVAHGVSRDYAVGVCDQDNSTGPRGLEMFGEFAIGLDGFLSGEPSENVMRNGRQGVRSLFEMRGAFSAVLVGKNGLWAARDPVGQKPLYYGPVKQEDAVAFASLRRALTAIGISEPTPLTPGRIFEFSNGLSSNDDSFVLPQQEEVDESEEIVVERLEKLLLEAASQTVPDSCGVAFSGGLDSTLVAHALKQCGKKVELFTVGMTGQPELDHARRTAAELGLKITVREFSTKDVVDLVPRVIEAVETTEPMIVGITIPFYSACQWIERAGIRIVVAGQLSDELFGGYARFEEIALTGNVGAVRQEVWNSFQAASANDFEPGDKAAVSLGLELKCPFAYLPFVKYGLAIPASMKVRLLNNIPVRKYILRKLAERWGLPESVVNRPKSAVQYSTGVMKVLEQESHRQGLGLREFLEAQVN